jgi:Zn-dependent protease
MSDEAAEGESTFVAIVTTVATAMPDLSFSLFRIRIRVQLWFLALAVIIGTSSGFRDPASVMVFCGIVFVSVLAHELGHAFTGRAFGLAPAITLHAMGGLTSWEKNRNITPGRSLVISLAGPSVGLALGVGLLVLGLVALPILAPDYHAPPAAARLFAAAVYVNIVWSLFNLAPVVPLDGGNALRSFWALTKIGDADIVARVISIPVAVAIGAWLGIQGWIFGPILMLLYIGQNVTGIRMRLLVRADEKIQRRLMEQYPGWLASKDSAAMIREGTRARSEAKTPHLVAYATEIVSMGQCIGGDARSALATLGAMPRGFAPSLDVALHVLDAAGEHAAALDLLRRAAESTNDPELLRKLAARQV